ncbi:MAG: hypothetical protein ACYCXW_23130 [Solirubrobacteraceae bacterium]
MGAQYRVGGLGEVDWLTSQALEIAAGECEQRLEQPLLALQEVITCSPSSLRAAVSAGVGEGGLSERELDGDLDA